MIGGAVAVQLTEDLAVEAGIHIHHAGRTRRDTGRIWCRSEQVDKAIVVDVASRSHLRAEDGVRLVIAEQGSDQDARGSGMDLHPSRTVESRVTDRQVGHAIVIHIAGVAHGFAQVVVVRPWIDAIELHEIDAGDDADAIAPSDGDVVDAVAVQVADDCERAAQLGAPVIDHVEQ
jgi:hypothetical protein